MSERNKKVMLLGGNYFQMTATKAAKELGYHVISVDYLPDNPAHKYADEYHNVSTTDKDAVLELARKLNIDGIVSYASDVSAPTAAYVAEKMGLPTNPYESVMILTQKDLFRRFMKENGFCVPEGKSFSDKQEAYKFFKSLRLPVMIKPTDASGSKGVTKVINDSQFDEAYDMALHYSLSGHVIIEQFIEKVGYQIDGDGFILDGKIRFFGVMDQHKDLECAPYVPIGLSCPSVQSKEIQEKARQEIQRIFDLLNMRFGAFNFEYIVDADENVYIIEIGPRNGGNFITDTLKLATGIDLASYTIRAALGEPCDDLTDLNDPLCMSSYILHSLKDGAYDGFYVKEDIENDILKQLIFVKQDEQVNRFQNGGMALGAMIIRFSNVEEMCYRMDHMNDFIKVRVK